MVSSLDFPGLGNEVTLSVAPLPLTSGVRPRREYPTSSRLAPGENDMQNGASRSRSPSPMPSHAELDLPPYVFRYKSIDLRGLNSHSFRSHYDVPERDVINAD